jgi:hypothetical protein
MPEHLDAWHIDARGTPALISSYYTTCAAAPQNGWSVLSHGRSTMRVRKSCAMSRAGAVAAALGPGSAAMNRRKCVEEKRSIDAG